MKKETEFQEIGKKLPFKTPSGFFEQVSEKTLREAKLRVQNHRKSLMLWRSVALAASLSALALLGYFMFEQDNTVTTQIGQVKQPEKIQLIEPKKEVTEPAKVAEVEKVTAEKTVVKENYKEEISDVLADMSDEDLLQLAAMLKTDPFTGESAQ